VLISDEYDSRLVLLEDPDKVLESGYNMFFAAFWFYMTPHWPAPSIHDIVTGYYEPNERETNLNITAGFGATTNIINGEQECGKSSEDTRGQHRIDAYKKYLEDFGLPAEDESTLTCGKQPAGKFPEDGSYGTPMYAYFEYDEESVDNVCAVVSYQTGYSIHTHDDYKRCICDNIGDGEIDCAQAKTQPK